MRGVFLKQTFFTQRKPTDKLSNIYQEDIMSKELAKTYDPKGIEERLYKKWMDNGYFHAKVNPDKKPLRL